jgi:hypothetical protein
LYLQTLNVSDFRFWLFYNVHIFTLIILSFQYSIGTDKSNTVTVTPNSGAALYRKDSNPSFNVNRPSTLQVASPSGTPPSSEPIPVPSQVAAYQRMQSNSPLSPQVSNKTFESGSPLKTVCRFPYNLCCIKNKNFTDNKNRIKCCILCELKI